MKVSELIAVYLRHCGANEKHAPDVRRRLVKLLDEFLVTFGDRRIADLKAFELRDWIEAHDGWHKSGTRRTKAAQLRAPFQWAADDGRIGLNPFKNVRYAEGERAPDFGDDVLEQLLPHAKPAFVLAAHFLRFTGCRISELCAAVWEDFDLDRAEWIVGKHKTRKTTRKAKLIPLIPEAVDLLKTLTPGPSPAKPGEGRSGPVFLNTYGKAAWTRASFWNYLDRLKEKHMPGYAASTHGIRHRFGSAAIANGASPKLVGAQMGHASVRTTEKYYVNLDGQADAIRDAARLSIAKAKKS